jgi:tetratricopeptide (TPR) repeat protein
METALATRFSLRPFGPFMKVSGIGLVFFFLNGSHGATADDLNSLLGRLQLYRLQAVQVEKLLRESANPDVQDRLQRKLADLYFLQLGDLVEKREAFSLVITRLRELEGKVAKLRTPQKMFQRLEVQFRHGEFLLASFREDRRQQDVLVDFRGVFQSVSGEFLALQQMCENQIEKLEAVDADGSGSVLDNLQADQAIESLSEISFRSTFYCGWSFFNYGTAIQDRKAARIHFGRALAAFCNFLDIDSAADAKSWNSSFMELDSNRNAQAFLGVALSFLALGQSEDADYCFDLLRREANAETKLQIPFWQIQALLELGLIKDGAVLASAYMDAETGSYLSAKQKGQVALMLIRFSCAATPLDASDQDLKNLGLRVLAQLRQFRLIGRLVDDYDIELNSPDYYQRWIKGELLYEKAEKTGLEADYRAAAGQLTAALAADREIPLIDVERCRNRLGWANYKGSRYTQAAECFEMVVSRLSRLDPKTAASAAWLQHDCYLRLSQDNPVYRQRALAILENLVEKFSDSELAAKARLQIVKIGQAKLPAQDAISRLREVLKSDPGDVQAEYELCVVLYRKFIEKVRGKESTVEARTEMIEALDTFDDQRAAVTPTQKLKILLIKIDLESRSPAIDADRLKAWFQLAGSVSEEVSNSNLLSELHYRQYQFAKANGHEEEMRKQVVWLVENGEGTVYQRSVLVARAAQLEKEIEGASSDLKRRELYLAAIDVYEKLVKANGTSIAVLQSRKNSRVAVSRLAYFLEKAGRTEEARRFLDRLVEAFPAQVDYLRRLGLLLAKGGDYQAGVPVWRKLAGGLKKESNGWYEAKFYLIQCLQAVDPKSARATLKQFLALYPAAPGEWKLKFGLLAKEMRVSASE